MPPWRATPPRPPTAASLKPGGKFVATDLFDAGGVALVARELRKRDLVHAGERNVDGRTMAELSEAEKAAISHRGRAARELAAWLATR